MKHCDVDSGAIVFRSHIQSVKNLFYRKDHFVKFKIHLNKINI